MARMAARVTCSDCGGTFGVPLERRTTLRRWIPTRCLFCAAAAPVPAPELGVSPGASTSALVFVSGDCLSNPGPGGWGLVHTVGGERVAEASGSAPETTNNRMELTAVLRALRRFAPGDSATVYSQSDLVVQTATAWSHAWARRGWTRKSGPIANLDLVQQLYAEKRARPGIVVALLRVAARYEWASRAEALAFTAAKRAGGAA